MIPNSNIRVSARAHVGVCACTHACDVLYRCING